MDEEQILNAVEAIMNDLTHRRGCSWDDIDYETRLAILDSWRDILRRVSNGEKIKHIITYAVIKSWIDNPDPA
jgi:hypothetical protein